MNQGKYNDLFKYSINNADYIIQITIYNADVYTLNPEKWLNPTIIYLYFTILKQQYQNEDVHIMDCLFNTMLELQCCQCVLYMLDISQLPKKRIIISMNQFEHHVSLMLVVRHDLLLLFNTFVADKNSNSDTQNQLQLGQVVCQHVSIGQYMSIPFCG